MIVHETRNCKLEFDDEHNCLIQNWTGFSSSELFREIIYATLNEIEDKGISNLISNSKSQKVVAKSDIDWLTIEINPKLVRNGLRRMAFVLPENVITQMSVKHFTNQGESLLEIRHFSSMDDAKKWIKS